MQVYNTLTAEVRYVEGSNSKFKIASAITIKLGHLTVATKTLGGRYSQVQALAEFRRNPGTFQKGIAYVGAQQLKLVA